MKLQFRYELKTIVLLIMKFYMCWTVGEIHNIYLQYELERLRPSVSQLVRAVGTIPAATARERLAQSEIAKKVHNN